MLLGPCHPAAGVFPWLAPRQAAFRALGGVGPFVSGPFWLGCPSDPPCAGVDATTREQQLTQHPSTAAGQAAPQHGGHGNAALGPAVPGLRVLDRVVQLRAGGLDWPSVTLRLAPQTSAAELFHRCARSALHGGREQLHWHCRSCRQLVTDYGPHVPATGHAPDCSAFANAGP